MVTDTRAEEIEVKPVNMDEFNTGNLQAALAESLQDLKVSLGRLTGTSSIGSASSLSGLSGRTSFFSADKGGDALQVRGGM